MSSILKDQVVHREFLVLQGLLAREGQHAAGEVGALVGRFDGGADALGGTFVVLHQLFDELQIAHHHHEQVVEVMGNAAGELADRFHFLGLQEFALQALRSVTHWQEPNSVSTSPSAVALGLDGALEEFDVAGLRAARISRSVMCLAELGKLKAFAEAFLVARPRSSS